MAGIIETRLTDDFLRLDQLKGEIASRFRSVINIRFARSGQADCLVTVHAPQLPRIPDSLVVENDVLARLQTLAPGSLVFKQGRLVHFPELPETLTGLGRHCRTSSLEPLIDRSATAAGILKNIRDFLSELSDERRQTGQTDGFNELPADRRDQVMAVLEQICQDWLAGDLPAIESGFRAGAGMGPGLTPSSDDALLGIMAVMTAARLSRIASLPSPRDLGPVHQLLQGLTTDVSLKYLCCAQDERFSDILRELASRLFSVSRKAAAWRPLIRQTVGIGGYSGKDMLTGAAIACNHLLRKLDVPAGQKESVSSNDEINEMNGEKKMSRKKSLTTVAQETAIEMFPGFFRTTLVYNEELMLCHFKLNKGAEIPLHHHVAVQNGYLIKGKIELLAADGSRQTIEAGAAYIFDSEIVHGAFALEDSEYVETFYPVRPEYYPAND